MQTVTAHKPKPYHPVVLSILRERQARIVLDAPCGHGWLGHEYAKAVSNVSIDGVGLWEFPDNEPAYRAVREHDLDEPLPELGRKYDAVVCGEAIHLVTNPGTLLASFKRALRPGGTVVITTPNTWHARSRGQFFMRGFHSGFSPMVGKQRGEYITYCPFSFPQLHLFLTHHGFKEVTLHDVDEPKPKRRVERVLGLPGEMYCRKKAAKASTAEEAQYWSQAGSRQSLYGRWLVVSAVAP